MPRSKKDELTFFETVSFTKTDVRRVELGAAQAGTEKRRLVDIALASTDPLERSRWLDSANMWGGVDAYLSLLANRMRQAMKRQAARKNREHRDKALQPVIEGHGGKQDLGNGE